MPILASIPVWRYHDSMADGKFLRVARKSRSANTGNSRWKNVMKCFICPNCKEHSIPLRDKYKAGMWRVIHCGHCRARLCAQPWVLAIGSMFYVWAMAWFGFWSFLEHSLVPLLYLIPVWLILDFLNIQLMPLSTLRSRSG